MTGAPGGIPGNLPIPDPTALTTEALRHDIGALAALIEVKLENTMRAIICERELRESMFAERDRHYMARFDGSDEAVAIALKAARDAASGAVTSQKEAVDAAFEASEKAITKAEISIEKRADATYVQLAELQRMLAAVMNRNEAEQRFGDLLDRWQRLDTRLTSIEAAKIGASEQKQGFRADIAALIGVGLFLMALIGFFAARGGP